jgi:hypothetical protein
MTRPKTVTVAGLKMHLAMDPSATWCGRPCVSVQVVQGRDRGAAIEDYCAVCVRAAEAYSRPGRRALAAAAVKP